MTGRTISRCRSRLASNTNPSPDPDPNSNPDPDPNPNPNPDPNPNPNPDPNPNPNPNPNPDPNQAESGGVKVEYGASALGRDVALSYALTVHKSQGSEYPVVVIPVPPQHGIRVCRVTLTLTNLALARCCRSTGACSTATYSTRAYRAPSSSSSLSAPKRLGSPQS